MLKNLIVEDSNATVDDIPSGSEIIVTVTGRNKGGESAETPPVNATVP